jgi:DNA (cytosine-5)-methyltransferase 1
MSQAFYNEIDPFAAAWLRELIKSGLIAPGVVDERSIEDICPTELLGYTQCHFFAGIGVWSHALRCAGWPDDRPVWTGSCPCQPFSAAGKRGGFTDERHLWPAFFHLISQCRPVTVFGEQVAKGNDEWLNLCKCDMEYAGYRMGMVDMVAVDWSPQERRRFYFVADPIENRRNRARVSTKQREGVFISSGSDNGFSWPSIPMPGNAKNFRDVLLCADGTPGDLASIAAYGNAIVAPVAEAWIKAYMDETFQAL